MTVDPNYIAARRVLLDALDALADQLDAVIVAGAQAVYLRTGDTIPGVAPYTTDGDLALDTARLTDEPRLETAMGHRFRPKLVADGSLDPGVWLRTVDIDGTSIDIPVDLIVPEAIAPPGGRRAARLGAHGNRTARRAVGLEAALVDHDTIAIHALDQDDPRVIHSKVAGPTALLIAKAHKIHDRLDVPDRLVEKDASDVYRLMQATPTAQVQTMLTRLLDDPRAATATRQGVELFRQLFGARSAPGTLMATRSLRGAVPPARVRSICTAFVADLTSV